MMIKTSSPHSGGQHVTITRTKSTISCFTERLSAVTVQVLNVCGAKHQSSPSQESRIGSGTGTSTHPIMWSQLKDRYPLQARYLTNAVDATVTASSIQRVPWRNVGLHRLRWPLLAMATRATKLRSHSTSALFQRTTLTISFPTLRRNRRKRLDLTIYGLRLEARSKISPIWSKRKMMAVRLQ